MVVWHGDGERDGDDKDPYRMEKTNIYTYSMKKIQKLERWICKENTFRTDERVWEEGRICKSYGYGWSSCSGSTFCHSELVCMTIQVKNMLAFIARAGCNQRSRT